MTCNTSQRSKQSIPDYAYSISILLLFCSFIYISYLVVNPTYSWVLPEAYVYKSYIIQNVPLDLHHIIRETFNYHIFENSERITRPLSSTFEIIDTHFRSWLWQFITPIPSLSLTFIFSLFFGSLLFYKLLLNLETRPTVAIFATAFMLLNPGTLSLFVMLFRPAKPMAHFWIIFSLYFASVINIQDKSKLTQSNLISFPFILGTGILIGFLFDETAIISVIAILLLFPSVLFHSRARLTSFLTIPLILLMLYLILFPAISKHFGFQKPDLLKYEVIATPHFPTAHIFFKNLILNTEIIFAESFSIYNPIKLPHLWEKALISVLITFSIFFTYKLWQFKKISTAINKPYNQKIILQSLLLIFTLCLLHVTILHMVGDRNDGRIWGLYWYGAYFGIFFGIFLAAIGEAIARINNKISYCFITFVLLVCLAQMSTFPYINFAYCKSHYYPYSPSNIPKFFRGTLDRFSFYHPEILSKRSSIIELSYSIRRNQLPNSIHKELYWIPIEMGALTQYEVPDIETVFTKYSGDMDVSFRQVRVTLSSKIS